jgi:type IV pilus assembly protein PilW
MIGLSRYQRSAPGGFSLIELMISLTLGLLVLGMVLTVYLSSMNAYLFQNGVLRVQENGRFAIDVLSRTMRMAGYDEPVNGTTLIGLPVKGTADAANAALTQTGIKVNTDIITVTYEGGTGIRDCQGRATEVGIARTNQYAVRDDFNLVCLTDAAGAVELELAEGIEDMQVLYGVDPDEDGVANHYVDAANVGAGNWDRIASVEITLLVNSVVNVLRESDNVCMGCVVFPGSTDRLIRAEFQTIVEIRN